MVSKRNRLFGFQKDKIHQAVCANLKEKAAEIVRIGPETNDLTARCEGSGA